MARKFNPFTGLFSVFEAQSALNFKEGVATAANLPSSGNTLNDARFTNDDQHLHIWDGNDWVDQGDIFDVNIAWGDITGTLSNQTDLQNELDTLDAKDATNINTEDVTNWDIANGTLTGVSLNTGLNDIASVNFSPDGTKMIIMRTASNTLREYTLSTPWDVSTATETNTQNVTSPSGFAFGYARISADGTRMILISGDRRLASYSFSSAWDISTVSGINSQLNISADVSTPRNIDFSQDGTKVFALAAGVSGREVFEYTLSTPWDVSTATQTDSFDYSPVNSDDIRFEEDGNTMYLTIGGSTLRKYTLSAPYDISSPTLDSALSIQSYTAAIDFDPTGTRLFAVDINGTFQIIEYSIDTPVTIQDALNTVESDVNTLETTVNNLTASDVDTDNSGETVQSKLDSLDTDIAGKADTVHTHTASDITDFDSAVSANADVVDSFQKSTDTTDDITEGSTNKWFTVTEENKLAGIEDNAKDDQIASEVPTNNSGETVQSKLDSLDSDIAAKADQTDLDNHVNNTSNPHNVTSSQISTTSSGETVQSELDSKEVLSNKSTDTNLGASDTLYPSQNAVKTYVDNLLSANDAMIFKGVIDASTNPNYPAADAGDTYRISVAGKIGGASGVNVEVGDIAICINDSTASGDQATVGSSWSIIQVNIDGAVVAVSPFSSTDDNLPMYSGTTGRVIEDSGIAKTDVESAITKSHDQNTDTVLDQGGANETSASEIRSHIDNTVSNPHNVEANDISTTVSGETVQSKLDDLETNKADVNHTHTASDITDFNTAVSANADVADSFQKSTDTTDDITEGTTNKWFTVTEENKLAGIEDNAKDDQNASEVPTNNSGETVQSKLDSLDADIAGLTASDIATNTSGETVQDKLDSLSGGGGGATRGTFTDASLSSGGVLTITHSLGLSAPYALNIVIFDNNGKMIIPDDVTGSTNSVDIDLSSFVADGGGSITGTWGYSYV